MSAPVKKRRGIKINDGYKSIREILNELTDPIAYSKRIEDEKKEEAKIQAKIQKIQVSLEKKLGYSKTDWTPLAIDLIFELHPDLQFYTHNNKQAGAKKLWDKKLLACLWMDIFDYQKEHPDQSINSICFNLAKKDFWVKLGKTQASLNKYYGESIKPKIDDIGYSSYFAKIVIKSELYKNEIRFEILRTSKIRNRRGLPRV